MRREETRRMTITAVFAAILIMQTFLPNIGYVRIIPVLPVAITTIPMTIAIYGTLMGTKAGLGFGLFWGITRLIVAYTQPGDMVSLMLFQNPVISVVPSVLAGFFPGLITKAMGKTNYAKLGYIFSGAVTSLTNTIMVILLTSIFFMHDPASLVHYLGNYSSSAPLILILITALGANGVIEAIFTALVVPVIVTPLNLVLKRA
ncbi:ECF transporter S component [Lactobacillus helveticus]|uniref:Integral membrane protein n=2 Tax=Lactobacillales TaxID=186826 RepID=U6F429_LACHE|nr:ECF transporter S component [Lactobacillus helveticus]AKG67552.1 membrane protein [Lactobacillus helveticus]MDY0991425.1 ECF transporter S component [Lactobacillus helveticus]MDY1002105.1 ECF transporter S component [Lactobacillus helveticus]MEB2873944.1 ECF transporter S component [Lactobacillus helveticus]RHX80492.1 ECF transporter S component [Lactobacillus helveticus]